MDRPQDGCPSLSLQYRQGVQRSRHHSQPCRLVHQQPEAWRCIRVGSVHLLHAPDPTDPSPCLGPSEWMGQSKVRWAKVRSDAVCSRCNSVQCMQTSFPALMPRVPAIRSAAMCQSGISAAPYPTAPPRPGGWIGWMELRTVLGSILKGCWERSGKTGNYRLPQGASSTH